ncbi:thiol peroxidase [Corynebacterium tapiri]|uniref:Thiol peroxidase n=1 Tax=Corynebacterium tapiri TaxID=1448266 RepID=A0A5C4U407_9CORY|nr:thiol peroxidase [Corynebacterium tapiri]TNL97755.1 thiol peroxidase [Corynebacterium tapiri]
MAQVTFSGQNATTVGELPVQGSALPAFELVGADLNAVKPEDFAGKRLVLNIFPSLDTGVCANSVRAFDSLVKEHADTVVLCISKDLPFAQSRFFEDQGIDNAKAASAFRSTFGEDFGVTLEDSPLQGLLARAVVVTDAEHNVVYTELVDEITHEPNYEAAEKALS